VNSLIRTNSVLVAFGSTIYAPGATFGPALSIWTPERLAGASEEE